MVNMVSAIITGAITGNYHTTESIMEHKVIQNLRAVGGDTGSSRQGHQKFTSSLGQAKMEYEEIAHRLAREIDLGKDVESVVVALARDCGSTFGEASMDL